MRSFASMGGWNEGRQRHSCVVASWCFATKPLIVVGNRPLISATKMRGGARDGRQPWPIAIAAGDDQKIVLIDRRGLDCHHHLAGCWSTDVGDIDHLDDLGRVAEGRDLNCVHA